MALTVLVSPHENFGLSLHRTVSTILRQRPVVHISTSDFDLFRRIRTNGEWIVDTGTYVELESLRLLLQAARDRGIRCSVDPRAVIVLPIHKAFDYVRAIRSRTSVVEATGVHEAMADFVRGRAITIGDVLLGSDHMRARLDVGQAWVERFAAFSVLQGESVHMRDFGIDVHPFHLEDTIDWCISCVSGIRGVIDAHSMSMLRRAFLRDYVVIDVSRRSKETCLEAQQRILGDCFGRFEWRAELFLCAPDT